MENKIKELQNKLPEGVDSFLSLDEKTVLYLTGFSMNDGALFVTRNDAVLFVDFRYIEAASEEAKNFRDTSASSIPKAASTKYTTAIFCSMAVSPCQRTVNC